MKSTERDTLTASSILGLLVDQGFTLCQRRFSEDWEFVCEFKKDSNNQLDRIYVFTSIEKSTGILRSGRRCKIRVINQENFRFKRIARIVPTGETKVIRKRLYKAIKKAKC